MNKKPSNKTWLWITIIVVASISAYYMFFSSPAAPASTTLLSVGPGGQEVGAQVLTLLNQIQSLRIDQSLFSDPAYQSLQDYSVPIPTENVGRDNPFAPIPGFSETSDTSSAQ